MKSHHYWLALLLTLTAMLIGGCSNREKQAGLTCESSTKEGQLSFNVKKRGVKLGTVLFDWEAGNLNDLAIQSDVNGLGESTLVIEVTSPSGERVRVELTERDDQMALLNGHEDVSLLLSTEKNE